MGFGGCGSMNIVIKNNRNLLSNPRREKFKNTLGSFSSEEKPEYDFPNATKHGLRSIKTRLQEEQKQRTKTRIMIMLVVSVSLISGFIYIML